MNSVDLGLQSSRVALAAKMMSLVILHTPTAADIRSSGTLVRTAQSPSRAASSAMACFLRFQEKDRMRGEASKSHGTSA